MLQSSLRCRLFATLVILIGLLIASFNVQSIVQAKSAAPQQTVVLSIDDISAAPGTTGTFQVNLNNANGPLVSGVQFTIGYDSAIGLELTGATKNANRVGGNFIVSPNITTDQIQIILIDFSNQQRILSGNGSILDIEYTVAASAVGNTDLTITDVLLLDSFGNTISTTVDQGSFTIDNGNNNDNAKIYIEPASSNMDIGNMQILRVMVDPGNAEVNGVQVHAKVDPAYLTILSAQANTALMDIVLEPVEFNASTGIFSYAAGRLGTVDTAFEILQVRVQAVAATNGTIVEFLDTFPKTDVNGPNSTDGSVMDAAENGVVVIDAAATTATLIGEIGLQGRPTGSSFTKAVSVTIQMFSVGSTTQISTFDVMLDQNGRFTRSGIAPGTYDIRMVNSHTLASRAGNVVLNAGDNNIYLGPLREGDVFQDNEVRANDFSLLANAYNQCRGSGNFDDRTDLNEDNCTDSLDFGLLSGNFNTRGDITYDVGNPPLLPIELVAATMVLQVPNVVDKAVGETFEVIVLVDTKTSEVNGATAHILFDPASLEIVDVTLLAEEMLPQTLEVGTVNNNVGTVSFSKGRLNSTVSDERFELARLTMRLKEETDAASLAFSDAFPATNVTGKEGTVLAETIIEEMVIGTESNPDNVPPAVPNTEQQTGEGQATEDSSDVNVIATGEKVYLPLILR